MASAPSQDPAPALAASPAITMENSPRATSAPPAGQWVLRLVTSSGAVYSRPSVSSSRITPISAPAEMNSSLALSGSRPP